MSGSNGNDPYSTRKGAFVPPGKASEILGIPRGTLRLWAENGDIAYVRKGGPGTMRYYDVHGFLERKRALSGQEQKPLRARIAYARVSTRGQLNDLERQKRYLSSRFPGHELLCDVGSGINWKRPSFRAILDRCLQGSVEEVVVAHPDRLARLGLELVRYIIEDRGGARLVVLNNKKASPQEELVADLLSIVTVFSARANGLRTYRDAIKKDFGLSDSNAGPEAEGAAGPVPVVLQ